MHNGELENISRFPAWEFFGTLTFQGREPSERKARATAINYFFRVARAAGVDFSSLVWVLREEFGEKGGRRHFHFLIGRTRLPLTIAGCRILERVWERLGGCRGFAKVKAYDRALSGAAYVCKVLAWVGSAGGASYEVRKFGTAEEPPMLSRSLRSWLSRVEGMGDGRRPYLLGHRKRGGTAVSASKGGRPGALGVGPFGPKGSTLLNVGDKTGTGSIPPVMDGDAPF